MRRSWTTRVSRWPLILVTVVALLTAVLTITVPGAQRPPWGVILLAVSGACWLSVLIIAHRLHRADVLRPPRPGAPPRPRAVRHDPRTGERDQRGDRPVP